MCAHGVICKKMEAAIHVYVDGLPFLGFLHSRFVCARTHFILCTYRVICKTFMGAFVRVELAGIEPAFLSFVHDGLTQVDTITAPP